MHSSEEEGCLHDAMNGFEFECRLNILNAGRVFAGITRLGRQCLYLIIICEEWKDLKSVFLSFYLEVMDK